MKTSVIIATYERQEDLMECVRSLLGQFTRPDEIIIVEDGNVDHTRELLADENLLEEVTHLEGPGEGRMASRNLGIETATGDVLCFLDDDVVLPPIWLREVLATYERNENVSGVGGHIVNFNPGSINKADMDSFAYRALTAFRQLFLADRVGDISPVGILWAPHTLATAGERDVDSFQGCNMTFRAEVFDEHQFDEWYGTSGSSTCEEQDFCARLVADGHRLIHNPRAVVVHKRSPSPNRGNGPDYANVTNLSYFILRNPGFGIGNFILFAGLVMVYGLVSRDLEYIKRVITGVRHFSRQGDAGK